MDVSISSNGQNFESSLQFSYYTEIELSQISPIRLSDLQTARVFQIAGSHFVPSSLIRVKVAEVEYSGTLDTTINFEASGLTVGRHRIEVSLNA